MLNENTNETINSVSESALESEVGSESSKMLRNWTEAKTASFQKEIMSFEHNLSATGLFTDEALIDLLERHPLDKLDVCTMGASNDPKYPNKFRTGDSRGVSAKVLLDAVKAGRIWLNLRQAMNVHEDYKRALDAIYGELADKTGSQTFNPRGGILISSPVARVPYHFDKTETILWHVRGKKRIYIYPLEQKFISDSDYEKVISDALNDDLPYDVSFDDEATVIDLAEGTALLWPLNSPHRVDNQSFCVSVTTEYSTRQSGMKNAAMMTNAALRSRLGLNPSYSKDGDTVRQIKSIFGRVIGKTSLVPNITKPDMVTFKIDETSDDFLVDVEPFQRNF